MIELTIPMKLNSEKKHSVRYDVDNVDNPAVTSIYIMKTSLPNPFPKTLTLIVKATGDAE